MQLCSWSWTLQYHNKKIGKHRNFAKKIHQIPQYFNTSIPSQNFRANVAIKNVQGPGIC